METGCTAVTFNAQFTPPPMSLVSSEELSLIQATAQCCLSDRAALSQVEFNK